jgi:hypothetical protein
MTTPDSEPPQRGVDPYAPVDYPTNYPGPTDYPPGYPGLPPPVYPAGYPPPYPGQFGDPYDPYRPAVPSGTNGKAVAAVTVASIGVVACACFVPSLVGIVLGFIAMGETKRTGQSGHGLAMAAVAIGIATLVLGAVVMLASFAGS